jgi:hypothetical protein
MKDIHTARTPAAQLETIVENKPVVDKLIEKVGRLKIKTKPTKDETQEQLVKNQRDYVKKLRQKPKKKISLEF